MSAVEGLTRDNTLLSRLNKPTDEPEDRHYGSSVQLIALSLTTGWRASSKQASRPTHAWPTPQTSPRFAPAFVALLML